MTPLSPPLQLPERWQTRRLLIADSTMGEIQALATLWNEACASGVGQLDPTFAPVGDSDIARLVSAGAARRNERGDRFQMQSIRTHDDTLIGYYHLVLGAGRPDLLWLSMFVIHPRHQGEGFGRETVTAWWPQFAAFPVLRRVRGEVWLKNWPALRFWVATGLRHIHLIRGDRRPEADTHASVILEGALHDLALGSPEAGTPTHRSEPSQS